jgi:flagella basal body P-ring formation protein FlgA
MPASLSTFALATLAFALAIVRPAAAEDARDVLVVSGRLHKGSPISCADVHLERRNARRLSPLSLGPACDIAPESVAVRELGKGDILRASDIGAPFAVLAGAPLRIDVKAGTVTISTLATALADARVGDELDVRLQNPIRTFKARVVAPGTARLMAGEL